MVKYGKYIKKTRRTFRKTSRFAKKARRLRFRKRFKRRLNSIAEKKLLTVSSFDQPLWNAASTGLMADGLVKQCWPASGTGNNQMVGSKIFIRYIKVDLWIVNANANYCTSGRVGLLEVREGRGGAIRTMPIDTFFDGAQPILNPNLFKQRSVRKMKLKTINMNINSSELPQQVHVKLKYKIFKEVTRDTTTGTPNFRDYYLAPVYFNGVFSQNGASSPARYYMKTTMTFTDV